MQVVFDLSNVLSNVARQQISGIARVERAWLRYLVREKPDTLFYLERKRRGILLDSRAGAFLLAWIDDPNPATLSPAGRLALRLGRNRTALALSIARFGLAPRFSLRNRHRISAELGRHLSAGTWVLSVSQREMAPVVVATARDQGIRIAQMLHDTIPLDYPEVCIDSAPEAMRRIVARMPTDSDLILCNSQATADDLARHGGPRIREIAERVLVSHLGVDLPRRGATADLPPEIDRQRPFFLILGTIEPRKNHLFLLELWEAMARRQPSESLPQLVIAGRWGWKYEAFRARLEASPLLGRAVIHLNHPDDDTLAALMGRAHGLLMPSLAEGYGLPVFEAAVLGLPVIANDLPVYREIPIAGLHLIGLSDPDSWLAEIERLAAKKLRFPATTPPSWEAHFQRVIDRIAALEAPRHGAAGCEAASR